MTEIVMSRTLEIFHIFQHIWDCKITYFLCMSHCHNHIKLNSPLVYNSHYYDFAIISFELIVRMLLSVLSLRTGKIYEMKI